MHWRKRTVGIPRDSVILIAPCIALLLSSIRRQATIAIEEYTRGHSRRDRCTLPAQCAYPKGRL